ncbi:MAG: tRNA (N6-threonylcarbamoyladenosine(37)-N6)-methyltransferase TrmO [Clostridia bacterium]|nr:tRNA (N6-threonylcarbamoyladenosine(37)-N6)-methyltransferase TrmO [Clostridia bacterium]
MEENGNLLLKPIARIKSDFHGKFGIPRQSGLAESLKASIVFENDYKSREYLREIDIYSHLWIIWGFSENRDVKAKPTVRPPRLGGNKRVGVFATRSPYRPNPVGISAVKIDYIEESKENGTVIHILGGDMADGTPVYDIKPYIPEFDSIPEAEGGFAREKYDYSLDVKISDDMLAKIAPEDRDGLIEILKQDPRPSYQNDPERIYSFEYGKYLISFRVENGVLYVTEIRSS